MRWFTTDALDAARGAVCERCERPFAEGDPCVVVPISLDVGETICTRCLWLDETATRLYAILRECDHARELLGSHISNARRSRIAVDPDVQTAYDTLQASLGKSP